MKHNVFDNDTMDQDALMHSALDTIIADGKRCGSLKESFLQHSEEQECSSAWNSQKQKLATM